LLIDDVTTYISASTSHGFVEGSNLYARPWPETAPGSCAAVVDYGGFPSVKCFGNQNVIFEQPRFNLLVRSTGVEEGRDSIESVYVALDGLASTVLSTGSNKTYSWIQALAPPFFVDFDENGRAIFSCNFECVKEVG
jgi:hypothetical protein